MNIVLIPDKIKKDFGVRALFGLITIIGAVFTLSYLAIVNADETARQILGDAMIAIIAFYFGIKAAQNNDKSNR